ncbi:MAG: YceI family protein [Pseudomonadota bacterium]|nr:YceI family protein [Pseudomonadota bacterium]MDO7667431.1 YceI family protein [Pseudomonadota bacterium]MDO7710694.1 YceI family protein [Pseudomonadota bacterium]
MNISKLTKRVVLGLGLSISFISAHAVDWVIDGNDSQLNFISIKKTNIAEVHEFKKLQGSYDSQGQFILDIDLVSVDTQNPVRDDRMKNYFFDVSKFSTAKITATINTDLVDAIAEGASQRFIVDANLDLHGVIKPLKLDIIVTRLVGAKLSVVSVQPVIINADDFELASGINKLMELASLPSISQAVPVSFYLTLKLK